VFQRYREIKEVREEGRDPEAGFTLIELLIVIVVLGILAAIVVFSLTGVTGQSSAAACNSDAKTVQVAVDAYNAEIGTFPADSSSLTSAAVKGGPYLHSWPSSDKYVVTMDGSGNVLVGTDAADATHNYDAADGKAVCSGLGS
jgi:general secretion pathway protein G